MFKLSHHGGEFQAIVMSGGGNRMYPLTEDIPKGLLPVGNKPLVHYSLKWLEEAQVNDVYVLCYPHSRQQIQDYIDKVYELPGDSLMDIKVREVPEDTGTADALRTLKDSIHTDFIILSCDTITGTPPHAVLDPHRTLTPTMTSLFYDASKLSPGLEKPANDDGVEMIGIEDASSRLVLCTEKSDLDDEELDVRLSLLQKFPRLHVHTQLRDAHVYVFKKWVMDLIVKNKTLSSIKLDVVPLLLECQYRSSVMKKEGIDILLTSNAGDLSDAYSKSTHGRKTEGIVCNAVVSQDDGSIRANSRWAYAEANRMVIKTTPVRLGQTSDISPKTQVGPDSIVGEGTKIDERCSVKKSVIGSHCFIGKNVKITNSIVMDYVTIEDNVILTGCIICNNASIHEKAYLKDCDVGSKFDVPKETSGKGESYVGYVDD